MTNSKKLFFVVWATFFWLITSTLIALAMINTTKTNRAVQQQRIKINYAYILKNNNEVEKFSFYSIRYFDSGVQIVKSKENDEKGISEFHPYHRLIKISIEEEATKTFY